MHEAFECRNSLPSAKRCSRCKQEKCRDQFYRNSAAEDGLQSSCIECSRWYSLLQRITQGESLRAQKKARWREHAEEMHQRQKEWYRQHRAERCAQERARYAREYPVNPHKYLARAHKRRVRIAANGGNYTQHEWEALCRKYGYICLWCDARIPLVADHVVPLARGGTNDIGNIQPLCARCNAEKGAQVLDFRRYHDPFLPPGETETER